MDMSKYASKAFLKPEDLESGPQRKVIAQIAEGQFGKPVLTFDDGTRLSVNATNVSALISLFGNKDSDAWLNQTIEVYVGMIRYNGSDNAAVLVRAPNNTPAQVLKITPAAEAKSSQPQPDLRGNLNDDIPF